jgi:hypothetical protein
MRLARCLLPVAAALAAATTASAASPPIQVARGWTQPAAATPLGPLAALPAWLQFSGTTFSLRLVPLRLPSLPVQSRTKPTGIPSGLPAV